MGTRCSLFLVLLALPLPARTQGLAPGDVDAARRHVAARAVAGGARAADVADLAVTDAYRDRRSGLGLVYLQQRLDGVGVADGRVTVAVGRDGAVVHATGAVVAGLAARAETRAPALSAAAAAAWGARHVGLGPVAFRAAGLSAGPDRAETLDGGAAFLQEPATARLAYHRADAADPAGALRLAWEVTLPLRAEPHWWVVAVDAVTGAELGRVDLVDHDAWGPVARADAREALGPWLFHEAPLVPTAATAAAAVDATYGVYALPAESPNHATPAPPGEGRTLVADPADPTASPFGWHDTNGAAGAEFTTTQGNNVHAYLDAVGDGLPDAGADVDGGPGLVFTFPLSHTMAPGAYVPAAVTNLFYWNNVVHDVTYRYGFDSAAGNFQASTYGLGGLGGDDVHAEAQDGSVGPCEAAPFPCVNNANFATPPDGAHPRMQMYLWTHTSPLRDGDLDNGVIVHEYTHGISNRLTGGPAAAGCLANAEQMGEGWSDWYALMLTLEPGDLGPDVRGIGTYVLGEPTTGDGVRAFPYSTSLAVDPRTYDAIETAGVPHGVGSVWAAMLWEVTWALIDAGGGAIGDVYDADGAAGNQVALSLVTLGMKLQPCFPGFVDGRDAILAADAALYGGAHLAVLWAAFAKRGLGYSATQGSTGSVTDGAEAFDVPPPAGTAAVGPGSVGVSLPVGGTTAVPVTITHTDGGAPALDFTAALAAAPLAPRPAAPSGALTVLGREATRGDRAADGTGTASFGTGGPDGFGYTWADAYAPDGPDVAFADISATGTPVTSWTPTGEFPPPDEGYADIPLPFPFPFYGVDRTAVRVFTNGFLTFSAHAADSYGNLAVPGTAAPNAVIAPLWDDLIVAAVMGATVHTGLLPDGRFVVQYTDVAQFAPMGSSLTFEVILSPDGTIEYQYGPLTGGLFGASVGIENDAGDDGLSVVFDAPYLTSGHAVRFTPPPPWVHAAPGTGTVPAAGAGAVTLTFDADGLDPGLYTADLVVTTNEIGGGPYTIPVSLQVGGLALADGAGWRMMALPVTGLGTDHLAAQNLVQGVPGYYPAAGANLFTGYDGTAWTPSTGTGEALPPGRALLWYLYDLDLDPGGPSVSHALPMTLTTPPGAVETAADVSVPLHTAGDGWNLVGNPFLAALDLSGLPAWATGGVLESAVGQVWDPTSGSYVLTTTTDDRVASWQGFFVENGTATGLTIPLSARTGGGGFLGRTAETRLVAFELESTDAATARPVLDRALALYLHPDATDAPDLWDAAKLRPLGAAYATLAFAGTRDGGPVLRAQESRPLDPTAAFDLPLTFDAVGTTTTFTLRWPRLSGIPDAWALTLRDLATGTEVDLREADHYTFEAVPGSPAHAPDAAPGPLGADPARGVTRFVLHVAPTATTAGEGSALPRAFALGAPAPNPTGGVATLRYDVPSAAEVTVEVFDVTGRRVATLASGHVEAGRHAARLHAGALAAGLYIVRMRAGAFTATRRLTVAR